MFELGNNLREARQRRRIDLVIAEQDTKIRSKYLAALETEDFDVLPGPVFVRGFLRTYSRYLGLDAQLFVDEYNARFGRFEEIDDHASPALGRPGLAQERDRRGRRTMRSVVVLTLVGIAVLAWSGLRADEERPAVEERTAEASQPVEAPTSSETVQRGAFDAAAKAASGTPARPGTKAATRPATTADPRTTADDPAATPAR
jgi:cytoskeletal protein RodZ